MRQKIKYVLPSFFSCPSLGFPLEGVGTFVFQFRPFFETATVHFLLTKRLTLSADAQWDGERGVLIWTPSGGHSGLPGEETGIAIVGLFCPLLSWEPQQGRDVVVTHDWQIVVYGIVTYISFLWGLCCRKWKLPCRGLRTQEAHSGGSLSGSTVNFVRLENMFAQFISICPSVPNLVQLVHKCVEIFFPAECWVIVDEFLF